MPINFVLEFHYISNGPTNEIPTKIVQNCQGSRFTLSPFLFPAHDVGAGDEKDRFAFWGLRPNFYLRF